MNNINKNKMRIMRQQLSSSTDANRGVKVASIRDNLVDINTPNVIFHDTYHKTDSPDVLFEKINSQLASIKQYPIEQEYDYANRQVFFYNFIV